MGDAFVPLLEELEPGLGTVPGYDGTLRGGFRPRWRAWSDRVIRLRAKMIDLCEDDPEAQAIELKRCEQDAAYWVTMWAWIDEPRPRKDEHPYKPFIPSAAQIDLIQWMQRHAEDYEKSDGYASKSRGWGATRTVCAFLTWGWRWREGWRELLISRKEDLVDKPQDLNSMFGFIDFLVDHMPRWMKPEGFDPKYHRLKLMLKNPENGSQITGESTTTKAGRGSRATIAVVDEAAFVRDFKMTWGTLGPTSHFRLALSTEAFEEGFEWYETWKQYEHDTDKVKQLNWYDNPWFDDYWLSEEQALWEHDPMGFQREYMRDPYAGFGQAVYPIAQDLRTIDYEWNSDAYLLVGIDWGRADDTAMVFAQFVGEGADRKLVWLDSYEKNWMPGEFYAHILTGIPPVAGDVTKQPHRCWPYWDGGEWEDGHRLTFTDRDKEIMAWMRQVPPSHLRVFCDPSGANKDSGGLSWVSRLVTTSKALRIQAGGGEQRGIAPFYKELFKRTEHAKARSGLLSVLPGTVFSRREGADKRLRTAFRNYRFNEPGDKATGEPTPIHDDYSHLVKAAETIGNYIDLGVAEPKAHSLARAA